jgi:hypothetical protein
VCEPLFAVVVVVFGGSVVRESGDGEVGKQWERLLSERGVTLASPCRQD